MQRPLIAFLLMPMLLVAQDSILAQEVWVPQNSGTTRTLYRVQFLDVNLGFAVGDSGTVVKTTNGGEQWTDVPVPTTRPVRDLAFVTDSLGWVVTGDPNASSASGAVWHTTNGGALWTQQPLGTTEARFGISFVSAEQGWACGSNNGPWDIRSTTNSGSSWSLQSGSGFGWTYDISCISPAKGWAVGVVYFPAASGFILRTTNGGAVWNEVGTGTIPFLYGIQFIDSLHGYAVGDAGTALASVNGGVNWSPLSTGTEVNLSDLCFVTTSLGWACGADGMILKTTDAGASWDSLQTGTAQDLFGIFFVDSATGWTVGESGTILKGSLATLVEPRAEDLSLQSFSLSQNFPNPFNASTEIVFELSREDAVRLTVHDLLGREVALLTNETLAPGVYQISFDAGDLPSGVYLYRLEAGSSSLAHKMALLR